MEVIIRATIISPGTPETLDTARYGGAGGGGDGGDTVQQSARTLGKPGGHWEANTEASTLGVGTREAGSFCRRPAEGTLRSWRL